jgi:hypothetical protein
VGDHATVVQDRRQNTPQQQSHDEKDLGKTSYLRRFPEPEPAQA